MTDEFDDKAPLWDMNEYRVARAQAIADLIREKIPLSTGMTAMEFGCGTGLLGFKLIDDLGELTFADSSPGMLEQVKRKLVEKNLTNGYILDVNQTPIPSRYDLVFSLMTLHHIEDAIGTIRMLVNSLNSGGYICLSDLDKEDGSFHSGQTVPHNGFERSMIERALLDVGVAIVDSCTGFVNRILVHGKESEFPVFMIIGKHQEFVGL